MMSSLKNGFTVLVIILILQELALRFLFPLPELANFDRALFIEGANENKVYPFYRNSVWNWESSIDTNHKFVHYLNDYGFRDENWKVEKKEKQTRILFLGDSFLEGIMADQSNTITAHFNALDTKNEFESMNMGIMGVGFNSYLKIIQQAIPIFKPDKVCLVLYSNDLSPNAPKIPMGKVEVKYTNSFTPRLLALYSLFKKGEELPGRFKLREHSFLPSIENENFPWHNKEKDLIRSVTEEVRSGMLAGKINPFKLNQVLREKRGLVSKPNLEEAFGFIASYSKIFDVELMVCYIPSRNQVSKYYYQFEKEFCQTSCPENLDLTKAIYNQHQSYLKALSSKHQIKFIDFTPLIQEQENKNKHLYWNYDEHMKGVGYQLIGKKLHEEYAKPGLIPALN